MLKIFLLAILTSFSVFAQNCPLGPKDDHLNIHQVMIDYGTYVGGPQNTANIGANYTNETVTSEDITKAVSDLSVAIACTNAVLAHPTGEMLPDRASFLQGDERKKFIDDFLFFTGEFRDALLDFQKSFQNMLPQAPEARDWKNLFQQSQDIDALVDHAHGKTSTESLTPTLQMIREDDIDANMKQIQTDMKSIVANIDGASQSNADLAQDMADLFKACLNLVPDAIGDMPSEQRSAAISDYKAMIQQGVTLSLSLKAALANSDHARALNIVDQLKQLKSDGHHKYNP